MDDQKKYNRLRKIYFYLVANNGEEKRIEALAKQIKKLEVKLGVRNG